MLLHESCVHTPSAGIEWSYEKKHAHGERKPMVEIGGWSILRIASPIRFRVWGARSTLQTWLCFDCISRLQRVPPLLQPLHGELHEKHILTTYIEWIGRKFWTTYNQMTPVKIAYTIQWCSSCQNDMVSRAQLIFSWASWSSVRNGIWTTQWC